MVRNVYIHIPFCKQKCNYCSFISFPQTDKKEEYLGALYREIKYYYRHEPLQTLYFGGGTPSLLSVIDFENLLKLFSFDDNTEITVEINPETVDRKFISELRKLGINRLSFGCQTFDRDILKNIGRKHTPEQVIDCVKFAQDAGFSNINLDFIYGLPEQNIKMFEADLIKTLSLNIQHISLYGLKIDNGCYFYNHMPDNLPDEDVQADMYLKAIEVLESNNFEHYEISNFALSGFESRHNLNYWDNSSYYGFGLSAHGYTGKIRYSNKLTLKDYILNPTKHAAEHTLSAQEQLEEEIFLGFRKMSGINVNSINQKFSIDFEKDYKKIIDKYVEYGHLVKTCRGYKLTDSGILISNVILSEFLH